MELSSDLSKHKYMFAIPAYEGKLQAETALSCLSIAGKLTQQTVSHCFNIVRGGALIDAVRNEIIHRFLHETECDTLICIDADIEFEWASMERLLVFSHHYPIVAGAYCGRQDPPKFVITPTSKELNEHGLMSVSGMGFGFVAVQRKCLEEMAKDTIEYYDDVAKKDIKAFFRTGQIGERRQYIGEDVWFFKEAIRMGFTPMLDPGIKLKHHGSKVYEYQLQDYVDQLLALGENYGIQTK